MATERLRTTLQSSKDDLLAYLRRLIVTIVVVALALLLWALRDVVILAFAAVLLSIALLAATGRIRHLTGLGHRTGLAVTIVLGGVILGAAGWFIWPEIQTQLPSLIDRLSTTLSDLEGRFGIALSDAAQWAGMMTIAQGLAISLSALVLVIVAAVFLAIAPGTYRDGMILLVPRSWHDKLRLGFEKSGEALRLWLQAQVLAMVTVGVLVGLGSWAIGLPSPVALGLLAGLLEFIPIIGPLAAAAPALLIAFGEGGAIVVTTILLYVIVQQIESNIVTPMLQRRIVHIPPVVLLFSFVALGVVFGVAGIVVAAPLSVALFTLVREFYVADLLGERAELEVALVPPKEPSATPRRKQRKRRQPPVRAGVGPVPVKPVLEK